MSGLPWLAAIHLENGVGEEDRQLIDESNEHRSAHAFTAVVRRHVGLVFGTAIRLVGDHATAEDITQSVFMALTRSAGKLGEHATLAGWLYRTTINKSREQPRAQLRRARRETVAWELGELGTTGDSLWVHLLPLLDEALLELRESGTQTSILNLLCFQLDSQCIYLLPHRARQLLALNFFLAYLCLETGVCWTALNATRDVGVL